MSPTTTTTHEILQDDNYFLWEFNARMTLAKKELLDHIAVKPEGVMEPVSVEWKVADMKALALIAKMLSPTYQSMIRDAGSAAEAWFILREFFVKRSLHNRIQLRKQLHEFQMTPGDNIMDHLLKFDDLCMKLAAVGDDIKGEERLVILLGSLSSEYDAMVKIIEARGNVDLYEAKEMLRREYDTIQKREVKESAFQAMVAASRGGRHRHGRRRNQGRGPRQGNGRSMRQGQHGQGQFNGRCFECDQIGHKRGECPQLKVQSKGDQYVFSVSNALADTALWLLDSGASSHMTYRREDFEVFRPFGVGGYVLVANGHRLEVCGIGSVRVALDGGRSALITDVLYIPGLDRKLLSVSALTAKGAKVKFEDDYCVISYRGTEVVRCSRMGKLYALPGAPREAAMASSAMVDDVTLWHARLGHAGQERLATIDKVAAGVPRLAGADASDAPCEGCVCGKMTVAQYAHTSNSVVKADALLALVHSDVIGPMETQSKGGARYVLVFVDDWSRYVQVYMIKLKSEVLTKFKEYKAFMEAATGSRLRCIRIDNGGEYTGKKFNQFCSTNGILHQTSAPYSPAQNGLAERMNRSLTEMARAMLYYQHLPKMWWAEAIATAAYTLNRLPNTARRETTPFELLWNVKPSLSHMRVFGSRGFVYVDAPKRTKWDAKAHRCIFLGYSETSKAYRVWDTEDERLVVSRTIALDERPPSDFVHDVPSEMPTQLRWSTFDDDDDLRPESRHSSVRDATQLQDDAMEVDSPPHTDDSMEDSASNGMSAAPAASDTTSDSPALQPGLVLGRHTVGELGQGGVTRNMQLERAEQSAIIPLSHDRMVFGGEFAPLQRQLPPASTHPALPPSVGEPLTSSTLALPSIPPDNRTASWVPSGSAPNSSDDGNDRTGEPDPKRLRLTDGYEIALSVLEIPHTYSEAMASPHAAQWKEAVRRELRSHFTNHTWDAVHRPEGAKVIGCKWVFAVKRDAEGNIIRFKARLVAQGFRQTYGIDYWETYSPVASLNTVRVFLSLCCQRGFVIQQYDVETAFLNGSLEEDVYMYPPEGIHLEEGMICKLRRSIYGLKQAAAVWHKTIKTVLLAMGFFACSTDPCLFVRKSPNFTIIVLYVDDLLIGSATIDEIKMVKDGLAQHFTLKDLGDIRYVLGIQVHYDREHGVLHMCQSQFVERLLEKFGKVSLLSSKNPSIVGKHLDDSADSKPADKKQYRELIGSLLYIANGTRPDICASVGTLSQYLESPTQSHMSAAIQVLRYIKGTASHGIKFTRVENELYLPTVYVDASWGNDLATRRSTSGLLVLMCNGPIIFKSKRQRTVALSSAEAEYMALSMAAQEALWLRSMLKELGMTDLPPTIVNIDNQAAIAIAENVGYQSRAKHIDLRYHFVRDTVHDGHLQLSYIPSAAQLADYMTKALPTPQFSKLVRHSGVVPYTAMSS